MNQKRQRRFVGPMKVLNYVQLRTCLSRTPDRVGNALEKMTSLLHRRQFHWLLNIRKNSPEAWRDQSQFGRICSHAQTEIIQARRLSEIAFNDLREGEKGKRFVSFVAVTDQASEADARCVLRRLHRQPRFTHPRSTSQHNH